MYWPDTGGLLAEKCVFHVAVPTVPPHIYRLCITQYLNSICNKIEKYELHQSWISQNNFAIKSIPQSSDSHLNAACKCTASRVGDTAHPPLHVGFPTRKRQDCWYSRDSLGTVRSETEATVSLTAPTTIVCSEQIAHSRTAGINLEAEAVTSTCFQLTTLALSWTQHKSRDQF